MKRLIAIAIIIIASINVMKAQDFHFGATAGLNLSNMTDLGQTQFIINTQIHKNTPTTAMIEGFHFGGLVNYKINDHFSIDGSLLYTTCGAKINSNVPATNISEDAINETVNVTTTPYTLSSIYNLSYFQIPILAKYKLVNGLNFFAGPYLGILLSAKENDASYSYSLTNTILTTGSPDQINAYPFDIPSASNTINKGIEINRYSMGLAFGVGYQLPIGIDFSAKYSLDLTNIFPKASSDFNLSLKTEFPLGVRVVLLVSLSVTCLA